MTIENVIVCSLSHRQGQIWKWKGYHHEKWSLTNGTQSIQALSCSKKRICDSTEWIYEFRANHWNQLGRYGFPEYLQKWEFARSFWNRYHAGWFHRCFCNQESSRECGIRPWDFRRTSRWIDAIEKTGDQFRKPHTKPNVQAEIFHPVLYFQQRLINVFAPKLYGLMHLQC